MKNVRLIGTGNNVKVIDCDTGLPIPGINKIELEVSAAGALCKITQVCTVAGIDIQGRIDEVKVQPAHSPTGMLRRDLVPKS